MAGRRYKLVPYRCCTQSRRFESPCRVPVPPRKSQKTMIRSPAIRRFPLAPPSISPNRGGDMSTRDIPGPQSERDDLVVRTVVEVGRLINVPGNGGPLVE